MPARRKWTETTRRAIHELASKGHGATEIARRLREGEGGVPAIDVPRRSVAHIAAYEVGRVDLPEDAEILAVGELGVAETLRRIDAGDTDRLAVRWPEGEVEQVGIVTRLVLERMAELEAEGAAA